MEKSEIAFNLAQPARTARKPLLGLTILMVEDSRYFSDAVRLMAIQSGARIRRADSLAAAHRHIRIYAPDVLLVDLNLPDGSGLKLIEELSAGCAIIAMSGLARKQDREAATAAGAKLFIEKPFFDLAAFNQAVLSVAEPEEGAFPFKPRLAGEEIEPDPALLCEDICQEVENIKQAISSDDTARLRYGLRFLASELRSGRYSDQEHEAHRLLGALIDGAVCPSELASFLDHLKEHFG